MAPSSDSSASRLCGGTRPPAADWRRRASSIDWTMCALPWWTALWACDGASGGNACGPAVDRGLLIPRSWWIRTYVRILPTFGHDLQSDAELDVGVELDRHLVAAERLDRLGHVQPAAVDGDAGLRLDRARDLGRGDRAEEPALGARLRRDADDRGHQLTRHDLGRLAVLGVLHVTGPAHRLRLLQRAVGRL